jgi:HEAT repeat protein
MRAMTIILLVGILAPPVAAQSIAQRVAAAPDGTVRMSFASREGVCGNGDNISIRDRGDSEWENDCEEGPVLVALTVKDHRVTDIRPRVGGRWRSSSRATDLGTVGAREAGEYLLRLAESDHPAAKDAIFAATIADSFTAWPGLLRIARNESATEDARKGAIFWLGQAAGAAVTPALDSIVSDDGDREVKESAIFALSQRPAEEGVPALIRIARTNRDPNLRRTALFWLSQSKDPRALDLFEELLTDG